MTDTLNLAIVDWPHQKPVRALKAVVNGRAVGSLHWNGDPASEHYGVAMLIDVEPEFQRKGIATQLWKHAQSLTPAIHQGPTRTPEGAAWARTVSPEQDHSYTPMESFG